MSDEFKSFEESVISMDLTKITGAANNKTWISTLDMTGRRENPDWVDDGLEDNTIAV